MCEVCTKSFSRVSILINHKKVHESVKNFVCDICEKRFHQKINLKMHMNIHTNERPYSCSCSKGFNQKSNLAVHQRICKQVNDRNMQLNSTPNKAENNLRSEDMMKPSTKIVKDRLYQANEIELLENTDQFLGHEGDPSLESYNSVKFDHIQTYHGSKTGEALLGEQSALVIEPICTPEYKNTVSRGQIPFVLFQPCKGSPVIVKVRSLAGDKHLLVPTTTKDFDSIRSIESADNQHRRVKHFQVPIVPQIHQKVDSTGQITISVGSPLKSLNSDQYFGNNVEDSEQIIEEQIVIHLNEIGEIIKIE